MIEMIEMNKCENFVKLGFNEKRMDVNFVEMGILVYGVILFQM